MSKSECVIYEIFYFLWYNVICLKPFYVQKSLLLLYATVCHLLVNEAEVEDRGKWVGKKFQSMISKETVVKNGYASDVLFEWPQLNHSSWNGKTSLYNDEQ